MPIYALADADFQNHPALRAPHLKQKGNWGLPVTAHYSLLTVETHPGTSLHARCLLPKKYYLCRRLKKICSLLEVIASKRKNVEEKYCSY